MNFRKHFEKFAVTFSRYALISFWHGFYFIKSFLRKFTAFLDVGYLRKWLTIGILIGIVAGVGSIVFYQLITWVTSFMLGDLVGYMAPVPGGEGETVINSISRVWMIPVVTTLGGLLSGILVYKLAPEAEGHGTDAAINSFHQKNGVIRRRVPLVKMVASAVTIGSGGSAGREGPVALIGAGFGSMLSDLLKLNLHDRRIALTIGMGAGIGSIFKAPLGGALLGTEILYRRDFEVDALFPSFVASITGYVIFASWHGWDPIFTIQPGLDFIHPSELIGYVILGLSCGLIGMLYGKTFYRLRDFFASLKVPPYFKPAIGGLGVGILGMLLPQVLGMGYGWIQFGINADYLALPVYIMLGVIAGKIIATSLSIGSGGSGGVFAPGLVIGGMVGGVLWVALKDVPFIVPPKPDAFVIVGMMALFGGIAKAPLAIMIMVSEMTNSYVLLAPCMIAVMISYFSTGNAYIYEHQVVNRGASPAHRSEYSIPLLKTLKVENAMSTAAPAVSPDTPLTEIADLMKLYKEDAIPVMKSGEVVGIVANLDLVPISVNEWDTKVAADIMSKELIVGYRYEQLDVALERMTRNNISHLIIVNEQHPMRLDGMLCMDDIIKLYRTHSKYMNVG